MSGNPDSSINNDRSRFDGLNKNLFTASATNTALNDASSQTQQASSSSQAFVNDISPVVQQSSTSYQVTFKSIKGKFG